MLIHPTKLILTIPVNELPNPYSNDGGAPFPTPVPHSNFFLYSIRMKKHQGFSLLEVLVSWVILNVALLGLADVLSVELNQTEKIFYRTLSDLHVTKSAASTRF